GGTSGRRGDANRGCEVGRCAFRTRTGYPHCFSVMNLRDLVLGRPLSTHEEGSQRVGVVSGIPLLGLDALSSAAYGPEAAMTLLLPLGTAGIGYVVPISAIIIAILLIVYASYYQTIGAYPGGGGSFTVARRNLGVFHGLLAAAALLLDY